MGAGRRNRCWTQALPKLEADIRAARRRLDGYTTGHGIYGIPIAAATGRACEQLLEHLAELNDTLRYWQQVRGDLIKIGSHWRKVVRANKTTVSVETAYSWTDRAPYSDIQNHRRPDPQREGSTQA